MRRLLLPLALAALALPACHSIPYNTVTIDNFEIRSPKLTVDKAFTTVTTVFVDRGFDLKISSKDSGVLTTEYKKFASAGKEPPFDYFLQIKASIRQDPKDPKRTLVRLTPIVKEVNRLNAGAFTENNLSYLTVEANTANAKPDDLDPRMRPGVGWLSLGQTMWMNVVSDLADQLGIPVEEITQNTTTTPGRVIGFGPAEDD